MKKCCMSMIAVYAINCIDVMKHVIAFMSIG